MKISEIFAKKKAKRKILNINFACTFNGNGYLGVNKI